MKKGIIFGGRNFKELLRDPLSWIFCICMPAFLLIVMQVVMKAIGGEAASVVPAFAVERFSGGVILFGFAFLSMFCATLISKDKCNSYLHRLFASPMKSVDYIVGYYLPLFAIAGVQIVITYVIALCFGMNFSVGMLLVFVIAIPSVLLNVGIGAIMGSTISEKAAAGISSAIVQLAAIFSGMWFDLDMIGGGFRIFCRILPFAHIYDAIRMAVSGNYAQMWLPLLITVIYAVAVNVLAVFIFKKKMKS